MKEQTNQSEDSKKDIVCLEVPAAQEAFSFALVLYLLSLLIVSYVLTTLVNYSELVNFKYDAKTTIHSTIIFIVSYKLLGYCLGFGSKYSLGTVLSVGITMVLLAYFGQQSNYNNNNWNNY